MLMIKRFFRRQTTLALIATAVLLLFQAPAVYAASPQDPPPPARSAPLAGFRLEFAWNRQQLAVDRLGFLFDHVDERISQAQSLIDRAKANGKDVSSLQSALDAFSAAVQGAQPAYESCNGIVSSHQGFDANGRVIDPVKAEQTVQNMAETLREIRSDLGDAGRALRDAIRAFRLSNAPTSPAS